MMTPRHIAHHAFKSVLLMTLVLFTAVSALAQEPDMRHVTPVKPETNQVKPPPKGTAERLIQQYITGDSSAAMQEARRDSLRRIYTRYPRLTDLSIGVNFIEPLFMAFGQSYASADVSATLNMWNRLQPAIELGIGWAKSTPDDKNFTYKGKPSPYVKVGANYNFMFKNSPDYQAYAGVRLGYSTMGYDVTDVHYWNSYWQEEQRFDITGERSHALWWEAGVGIKVKLFDKFAMGWMVRYHNLLNHGKNKHSRPWFIPGYGPRGSSLGLSLSLYYTLPFHRRPSTGSTTPSHP